MLAAAATLLRPVFGNRLTLHVAAVGQRHHQILRRNEVFCIQLSGIVLNLRATLIAELSADRGEFLDDDGGNALRPSQDVQQIGDLRHHFAVFLDDLVLLQPGEALQAHLQDFLRLRIRQLVQAVALHTKHRQQTFRTIRSITAGGFALGANEHVAHEARIPTAVHQLSLGNRRGRRGLDDGDELIDIGQCNSQTFKDVAALACLAQVEYRATRHHLAAVQQEALKHLAQVQQAWLAVDKRDHVHTKRVLQLRILIEVVEHDLWHLAALEFDHHAHAGLVRLVANVGNAFDALFGDQLGDALEQRALVNLIRQLVDDDRLALAAVDIFKVRLGAHHHTAAARAIALANTRNAVDDACRWEVRRRDQLDQLVDRRFRIAQQVEAAIDDFIQVMRRNVRRHTHRDPGRTVDQQVGDAGRQNGRFSFGTVVVRLKIDGFLVEVGQQFVGNLRQADFGVTHRRGVVAIDGAEVALAVDQHVAQREVLRHPHDGVVYSSVAVGVILTDHIPDNTGRLLIGAIPVVVQLVHRVKRTAMHRLETIPHIWKRAAHDYAHGVSEIRAAHFFFERYRECLFGELIHWANGGRSCTEHSDAHYRTLRLRE